MSSTTALSFGTFVGAAIDALTYIMVGWAVIRAFYAITKRRYRASPYIIVAVLGGVASMIVASAINPDNVGSTAATSGLARALVALIMISIAIIIGVAKHKKSPEK